MKGTLYGLGLAVTRFVSNKLVPHPPAAPDGAPAIPRNGITKRPRQGSPTAGTDR